MSAEFRNKEEFLRLGRNIPLFTLTFTSAKENSLLYAWVIHFNKKPNLKTNILMSWFESDYMQKQFFCCCSISHCNKDK